MSAFRTLLAAVAILFAGAASAQTVINPAAAPSSATIVAPRASTIVTGGTGITVFNAGDVPLGGWIVNPPTAAQPLCIGLNVSAANTGTTSGGTVSCVQAGMTFALPALGPNLTVTANATDSGHSFTAVGYR